MPKANLISSALVPVARLFASFLVLAAADPAYGQSIVLSPGETAEGAKSFTLKVRRRDGKPFAEGVRARVSVGVAYGPRLVMLEVRPDRARNPKVLTVTITDLSALWDPAPHTGDDLLVAVYLNKKPITEAAILRVVEIAANPLPSSLKPPSLPVVSGSHVR